MPSPHSPFPPHSSVTFERAKPPVTVAAPVTEPYVYREYPRWKYAHGQPPRVVQHDQERATLSGDWAETVEEAERIYERQQELIANAAAEANWSNRRLSPKAKAERLAAERATDQHLPE
jgi:hypothetical protein